MLKNNNLLLKNIFIGLLFFACGSNSDDEGGPIEELDTTKPTISCNDPINVSIESYESEAIVTYTAPVVKDNLPGVKTEQIEGLASGAFFPVGITTNTFMAIDAAGNTASCSFNVTVTKKSPSSEAPYLFENVSPNGKKWTKVENLSDEFSEDVLDDVKWKNTDPARWIGRAPGLFKKNTVSQANGNLQLTADILPVPEVVNGTTFTHAGSNITSNNAAEVGMYFECRMKSSKTFMSSTFWLINVKNEATGCDVRTTELDIQECVGQISGTDTWSQDFDKRMSSNTHSRNTTCAETPSGSIGNHTQIDGKTYEEYHVYAAWWKSATEIQFFLDGKKVATVTPKAEFNLKMYLKMVVETYDWNPVPTDGGMTGSTNDRTTYYDWVRTWKLENE